MDVVVNEGDLLLTSSDAYTLVLNDLIIGEPGGGVQEGVGERVKHE